MRIHTRLAWLTLIVSLIALGSATLFWNAGLKRDRREELDDRLLDQVRILSALLPAPEARNLDRIDRLIRLMHRETRSRITVIALDGTVLAESNLERGRVAEMENHRDRPEVQEALRRGLGRSSRASATLGMPMAYVAARWGPSEAPFGVVRASLPMTRVIQEQNRGRGRVLLVVLGSLFLAGLLGYVAARRISRPLARISAGARFIGRGRLDRRLELEGSREAKDLALAVNQLADSLQSEIRKVDSERQRLARLLQDMPDGILTVDQEGKITLINAAAKEILELEVDALGVTPVEALRNRPLQEAVDASLADRAPRDLEIHLTRPGRRVLAVALVPLAAGLVVLIHDITRLRRLEEARREMVANIGHELRTPLSAILGYLETLEHEDLSEEDRTQFLQVIARNSRRLERLVKDLSRLSRLESHPEALAGEPVPVRELVDRAIETLTPKTKTKRIRIRETGDTDHATVRGDPSGLETVLLNLLDNAIRVTPEGEEVVISTQITGNEVRVSVRDRGPGIPPDLRKRIFERFYRVDAGRAADEGGAGLGLAIVKHTVQLLGGRVWVEDAPEHGAVLVFTVPAWTATSA
jgi:two-component system phosphate regulon sensor histidine kinase PhoR